MWAMTVGAMEFILVGLFGIIVIDVAIELFQRNARRREAEYQAEWFSRWKKNNP